MGFYRISSEYPPLRGGWFGVGVVVSMMVPSEEVGGVGSFCISAQVAGGFYVGFELSCLAVHVQEEEDW